MALAVVWVLAAASADAVVTPGPHCHKMPCCPRSDGGTQECSSAQCTEQVPGKDDSESGTREAPIASPATLLPAKAASPRPAIARRELTPGLCYTAAVFRLKDDLRI